MKIRMSGCASGAAWVLAALMAGCGGGGDSSAPTSPNDGSGSGTGTGTGTGSGSGVGFGSLVVTGPGAASVGGDFTPASLGYFFGESGPDCVVSGASTTCTSGYSVGWTESSSEKMLVSLNAVAVPPPGVAPGEDINNITIIYEVFLGTSFVLQCGPPLLGLPACDLPALGLTLDKAARTMTFVNTPLLADNGTGASGGVILNGTITY